MFTGSAGNTVGCSFTVNVTDGEGHVFPIGEGVKLRWGGGSCGGRMGSDICLLSLFSDGAGNTAECSFTVTVREGECHIFTTGV